MKQRDEDLSVEINLLKHKVAELEQAVKGQRHGILSFMQSHGTEDHNVKTT